MEALEKLASAITMVEEAKSVPLSASCIIHRGELLAILDQARVSLPSDLERAMKILREQERLIEDARGSADALIAQAREEVSSMVAQTEIVAAARKEAKKIIDDVNDESEAQQDEIDAYVDARLATLEVILNKTLDTITKGRARLAGIDAKSALTELSDKK
jgi:cell division septum initiation protein DivIVA